MMQIKSIVLYNDKGEIRQLNFKLGCVNLITGDHDTGKSALIPIINYCLGHSDFEIPERVITDSVTWYAVLYQIGDIQAFIAKPKPRNGKKEHEAFYKVSEKVEIPDYKNLIANSNDYYIKKDLSMLLRKSLNLLTLGYEQTENLKTTIDYTNFYLFQPIKVSVSNEEIFYKQRNNIKTIKETLPYFLGAKKEDALVLQEKYTEVFRELQKTRQALKRCKDDIKNNEEEIKNFFAQAQDLKIIEKDLLTENIEVNQMISRLEGILNCQSPPSLPIPKDFEPELRERLTILRKDHDDNINQSNLIKSYNKDIDGYSKEAKEHQMRLQSIGLFEIHKGETANIFLNEKVCPLCNCELQQNIPSVSSIKNTLQHLNANLKNANHDKVDFSKQLRALEKKKETIEAEITRVGRELLKTAKEKRINEDFFGKDKVHYDNIMKLIGVIEKFFKEQVTIDFKKLENNEKLLEQKCESIKSGIQQFETESKHKLVSFNEKIGLFASEIDLSHQGSYLFDLDNMNITVSDVRHPHFISMKLMGGLDILGCHLITLLALHKFFIYEKRPVPNFLVLDQPIQGYLSDNKNDDTDKINKMIQLILEVCKKSGLQVILTEHEQLPQKELHRVESHHWTAENALIPKSWIK